MNNFGFGNFNNLNPENPLMNYLRQYTAQQPPENTPSSPEPKRTSSGGISAFEISSKADIEYIEPDKSGRRQIYICDSENKLYIGRYNHVRKEMDYRAYIDEGEVSLFQKNDTSEEMSKIAQALVAVAGKLEAMHSEIQELKNADAQKEDSGRRPNGQFKRKGEK